MRKLNLLIWILCIHMQLAYGQNYTVSSSPPPIDIEAQIDFALSDIDFTPVTSGLLKDKTTLMGHPDLYGPSTVQDSQYTSMQLLSLQYKSLYRGLISGSSVSSPDAAYSTAWKNHDLSSTTVPMRLLAMEYHQFRTDAVDQGILYISGGKLKHNVNLPHSAAYETVTYYQSGLFSNRLSYGASIPNLMSYTLDQYIQY